MTSDDEASRALLCGKCGAKLLSEDALSLHLREHGADTRPLLTCNHEGCAYLCNFEGCQYLTQYSGHLVRHRRVHSSKRPYKCTILPCTMAFRTFRKLKAHRLVCRHRPEAVAAREPQVAPVARALQRNQRQRLHAPTMAPCRVPPPPPPMGVAPVFLPTAALQRGVGLQPLDWTSVICFSTVAGTAAPSHTALPPSLPAPAPLSPASTPHAAASKGALLAAAAASVAPPAILVATIAPPASYGAPPPCYDAAPAAHVGAGYFGGQAPYAPHFAHSYVSPLQPPQAIMCSTCSAHIPSMEHWGAHLAVCGRRT